MRSPLDKNPETWENGLMKVPHTIKEFRAPIKPKKLYPIKSYVEISMSVNFFRGTIVEIFPKSQMPYKIELDDIPNWPFRKENVKILYTQLEIFPVYSEAYYEH